MPDSKVNTRCATLVYPTLTPKTDKFGKLSLALEAQFAIRTDDAFGPSNITRIFAPLQEQLYRSLSYRGRASAFTLVSVVGQDDDPVLETEELRLPLDATERYHNDSAQRWDGWTLHHCNSQKDFDDRILGYVKEANNAAKSTTGVYVAGKKLVETFNPTSYLTSLSKAGRSYKFQLSGGRSGCPEFEEKANATKDVATIRALWDDLLNNQQSGPEPSLSLSVDGNDQAYHRASDNPWTNANSAPELSDFTEREKAGETVKVEGA